MFDKVDLHNTLILAFFAFLGGLTRELNDIISNQLHVKTFVLGLVTASTTGIIISQALLESGISLRLSCFLTGIAGFMGPYVLLAVSKILERKLIAFGNQDAIDAFIAAKADTLESKVQKAANATLKTKKSSSKKRKTSK